MTTATVLLPPSTSHLPRLASAFPWHMPPTRREAPPA